MKKRTIAALVLAVALSLFAANGALASYYLWFDPSGSVNATAGETVSVDVYLHAGLTEHIYGWGLNVGFDDSAYGSGELTYVSSVYGAALDWTNSYAQGYLAGQSSLHSGESLVHFYSYDFTFEGLQLVAGQDYLLATLTFTFTGGTWDGNDLWVEWDHLVPNESFFDVESVLYGKSDPMNVLAGPDYGNAVPIPAAGYLLGGGLLALLGMRRKTV